MNALLSLDRGQTQLDALAKASAERYPMQTAEELAGLPPMAHLIKPVIPCFGVGAFFGASGCGKTFLILDLGFAIAGNGPWFGFRNRGPVPVVYVGLEGSAGLPQRTQAIIEHKGIEPGRRIRFITDPLSLLDRDDIIDLAERIGLEGMAGGVVIIDTLNAASPGADENDSRDMGRIIAGAKELQRLTGGVVILVHHSGKDAGRGLRGHSSLLAALDFAIEVSRTDSGRAWKIAKSKDASDGDAHPFALRVVEIGEDEDGDPITSCIVEPVEDAARQIRKLNLPAGGNQRIAYDALVELLKTAGNFGKASAPPTRPCIEVEQAIIAIRDRLAVEPKRKTERARDAVTGLINRGAIKLEEGWVWLA